MNASSALRGARLRRGWTEDDVAVRLHQLAGDLGEPSPGVDAEMGAADMAESYARRVIAQSGDHPRRASMARVDLAMALLAQREPEESCRVASHAFRAAFLREHMMVRAGELVARISRQYPHLPAVRTLVDQYRVARRAATGPGVQTEGG